MLSDNNKIGANRYDSERQNGNAKLWAVLRRKGVRDTSGFKKAFGKYPDFPSVDAVRKIAWE